MRKPYSSYSLRTLLFSPSPWEKAGRGFLRILCSLTISLHNTSAQVKILFDATSGQSAGNADWVIDADSDNIAYTGTGGLPVRSTSSSNGWHSNAQRFPTPPQSGVTATTPETYWKGALSNWAIDMVKLGYEVETLPTFDSITYGNPTHAQDLSNYKVFIIDEPQFPFSTSVKTALMNFVKNGGGLFMVSDHDVSSRTNNGWDSPHVWDDFIENNPVKDTAFGFTFDLVNISPVSAAVNPSASDSVIHGPMGNCPGMEWHNGTTSTLYPSINSTITGDVFLTAVGSTGVMFGHGRYGKGKFAFQGDSSPNDDGTGNEKSNIYNGFTADSLPGKDEEEIIIVNATIWLASDNIPTGIAPLSLGEGLGVMLYPNPANTQITVVIASEAKQSLSLELFNILGQNVLSSSLSLREGRGEAVVDVSMLGNGIYIAQVNSDNKIYRAKFVKE